MFTENDNNNKQTKQEQTNKKQTKQNNKNGDLVFATDDITSVSRRPGLASEATCRLQNGTVSWNVMVCYWNSTDLKTMERKPRESRVTFL